MNVKLYAAEVTDNSGATVAYLCRPGPHVGKTPHFWDNLARIELWVEKYNSNKLEDYPYHCPKTGTAKVVEYTATKDE